MRRSAFLVMVLGLSGLGGPSSVLAYQDQSPAVLRGAQFLRGEARNLQVGESALVGLALVKAELPPNDPGIQACLSKVLPRFAGSSYQPERTGPGGHSIYEAGVTILFLANLDPALYQSQIEAATGYLVSNQMANGAWDYNGRTAGDTSISQYGVLGLWEGENAGAKVSPQVWDRAARWFISTQSADGGWCYHPDEGARLNTLSMTAAGVGSLLICRRQLGSHAQKSSAPISPLLVPIVAETETRTGYRAETTVAAMNAAINRGIAWLSTRFNLTPGPVVGQSVYYGLYGIERVGALADRDMLGGADWFTTGSQFINGSQQPNGAWNANYGAPVNTAWAILFSTKSTAKSLKRIDIRRLGSGTLIGGRGLPQDLTSLTIAGGHVLARPMNGAIDEMLTILEDPRAENADSALAGLMKRYEIEGPKALAPHRERFRKMLRGNDPGIRASAAWLLGRLGETSVAPDLIAALEDPDETVVDQARQGLQLLSRRLEGFGPAPGASLEERQRAAKQWTAWYEATRPGVLDLTTGPRDNRPAP